MAFSFGGDDGGAMSLPSLASLICCTLFTTMSSRSLMAIPIKPFPILGMMFLCCCCSCSSSATLVSDTRKRLGI